MPVIEERFEVPAAPATVWAFLLDPERLAPCLPGCESLEVIDERTYRVRLAVKVGFLSTVQDVLMTIVEAEPPRRLVAEGRGEDRKLGSQVDVRSTLGLEPGPDGGTTVDYRSEVRVLGRLGSVGDAVMRAKARELAGRFAASLRQALAGAA
ncbi:MAG: carbon monoxide dehydrogenase subunit G [Candidatus Rokubacteria bacterium]|nr:carbon monoxide dehydrogenase subunit G [Candidatus Rokubacteria bacterium]